MFRRKQTNVAALLFALVFAGCEAEPAEPPAPVDRVARPLEGVQIETRTKVREIEIELDRLEELKRDPENAVIVDSRPEVLDDVGGMIEETRSMVDVDENGGREFDRFRKQVHGKLEGFERRLTQLRSKTPASGENAGVSSD